MNTEVTWQTNSTSSAATEALGEQLGKKLKGGEVIELVSDLGGGKTTFVRGLARGLGSKDNVNSPTFKIGNEYHGSNLKLYHFDFYRLRDPGVVALELHDALDDSESAVVLEWGEIVQHVLPEERLTIKFTPNSESERRLLLSAPKSLQYLFRGLS